MTKRFASLTSTFLLVLGIAAFTGSALAGNGNGNGAGNAATPAASAQAQAAGGPGNSENAPGQLKKDSATAQGNGGTGSASQNTATSNGVKPTNATAKAKDTHAMATSNQTKRYGNGTTAGQVAVQAGYTGMLHGPGNSQPHKAAVCPRGHEVDVHALKAKGQQKKCAVSTSGKPTTSANVAAGVTSGHSAPVSAAGGVNGAAPTARGNGAAGGVLGVIARGGSGPVGGVLGAIQSVGQGVLPFTGFPLWIAVLAAVGLIALGLALRRRGRVTV